VSLYSVWHRRLDVVDVYYMYRLAATHTPQSSQGTSKVCHPRLDYELLL